MCLSVEGGILQLPKYSSDYRSFSYVETTNNYENDKLIVYMSWTSYLYLADLVTGEIRFIDEGAIPVLNKKFLY